ncbi:MAG: DUF120 domain-containing protein [Nitrososphaerota archaeon]|nr:CTP-dependent riboflavin kinase [Nitrososphaerales archaeon]MDW8044376.1 DUF120 domain-containing protein [Nitrososphaerota archaeon]
MKSVKPTHFLTLLELLLLGAKDQAIRLSTIELAKRLERSQQAASKYLCELEKVGYIIRMKSGKERYVKLTDKGIEALLSIYSSMRSILEATPKVFEFKGCVFSGLREGAYYISLEGYRRQFIQKLGFDPYPGTLNVRLTSAADRELKRELSRYQGIAIEGFEDKHRTYGGAKCFPALINDSLKCAVVLSERTHYDDSVIEIIAPISIRKELHLKDGDLVRVKVYSTSVDWFKSSS